MKNGRIDVSKTHPTLYRMALSGAVFCLLLAANYWFAHPPTFTPFSVHKNIVGAVFCLFGVTKLFSLIVLRSWRAVCLVGTGVIFWTLSWGLLNTEQGFDSKASFALPLFCLWVAVWNVLMLIESPVNPMTQKESP